MFSNAATSLAAILATAGLAKAINPTFTLRVDSGSGPYNGTISTCHAAAGISLPCVSTTTASRFTLEPSGANMLGSNYSTPGNLTYALGAHQIPQALAFVQDQDELGNSVAGIFPAGGWNQLGVVAFDTRDNQLVRVINGEYAFYRWAICQYSYAGSEVFPVLSFVSGAGAISRPDVCQSVKVYKVESTE